jgi:hypothetical protein
MLARLSDADIRARMPKPLPAISPSAPRNLTALMARIAEIRRTGYSEASNESLPGVGSLGFALTRRDTNETIGVAVSYPSQLTSTEERAKLWQALRAMAVDLGRLFDDPYGSRWMAPRPYARPQPDECGSHGHHAYCLADRAERAAVRPVLLPADGADGHDQPAHRQSGRAAKCRFHDQILSAGFSTTATISR